MPGLDVTDSRPLYAQLAETIREFIRDQGIASGSLLPTESELMKRFGASRTTVRQAIQRLEDSGLVRKIQGKGTFVMASLGRNRLNAFRSVEPGLAEQGKAVTNIMLDQSDGVPPPWAVSLGFPDEGRIRVFRRLKIVEDRPLALEVRVLPLDVAAVLTEDDLIHRPFYDVLDINLKTKIQHVTYSITAGIAAAKEADDMGIAPGTPLLIRSGLYYNLSGQSIMAAKVFFVAERVELRFEFDRKDDNWGIILV